LITTATISAVAQFQKKNSDDSDDKEDSNMRVFPSKKRRGKLPESAIKMLREWLFQHIYHPYPTEDEKNELCLQTELSLNQVNNWFINARRRIIPKNKEEKDEVVKLSNASGATNIIVPPSTSMSLIAPIQVTLEKTK